MTTNRTFLLGGVVGGALNVVATLGIGSIVAIRYLEILGVNSSANGVRLPALYISSNPQAIHSAQYSGMMKHGQRYIYEVTNNIMRCNTKVEAIEYLTRLRRRLLDGTINLYE